MKNCKLHFVCLLLCCFAATLLPLLSDYENVFAAAGNVRYDEEQTRLQTRKISRAEGAPFPRPLDPWAPRPLCDSSRARIGGSRV